MIWVFLKPLPKWDVSNNVLFEKKMFYLLDHYETSVKSKIVSLERRLIIDYSRIYGAFSLILQSHV